MGGDEVGDGIIPAYAGSTQECLQGDRTNKDHPRIRGEHSPSPERPGRRQRIIPAYAGSTSRRLPSGRRRWDHPRIRGEHNLRAWQGCSARGSSPHTRGAPQPTLSLKTWTGIIPAYAGSTCQGRGWLCGKADHPRIRGEHLNRIKGELPSEGSSPHTRGAPSRCLDVYVRERIIPAYAGSTMPIGSETTRSWDHPRIRGEHTIEGPPAILAFGSSPHTRGARRSW